MSYFGGIHKENNAKYKWRIYIYRLFPSGNRKIVFKSPELYSCYHSCKNFIYDIAKARNIGIKDIVPFFPGDIQTNLFEMAGNG